MFYGSIPALITPFEQGEIAWKKFEDMLEWQVEQGSHGVVPCGTTGESPTLSHEEHMKVVERCVAVVNGRIPVIAGTGSNSTKEAIGLTQHAQEAGADAVLIVMPYYNKPTQAGMIAHFAAIHEATDIPIIIYNIPGRSVVDMSNETMAELAKLPRIIGVKDATNDLTRTVDLRNMIGMDFCLLSGEDGTVGGYLGQGGHGCISVVANVAPALSAQMHEAWREGNMEAFGRIRDLLGPLSSALFCETSPAPVKYAMSILGKSSDEVRLPLVKASHGARQLVDSAMRHAGIVQE